MCREPIDYETLWGRPEPEGRADPVAGGVEIDCFDYMDHQNQNAKECRNEDI